MLSRANKLILFHRRMSLRGDWITELFFCILCCSFFAVFSLCIFLYCFVSRLSVKWLAIIWLKWPIEWLAIKLKSNSVSTVSLTWTTSFCELLICNADSLIIHHGTCVVPWPFVRYAVKTRQPGSCRNAPADMRVLINGIGWTPRSCSEDGTRDDEAFGHLACSHCQRNVAFWAIINVAINVTMLICCSLMLAITTWHDHLMV